MSESPTNRAVASRGEAVVMYSGGTDSTWAACVTAREFHRVHLLSYRRHGLFGIDNSDRNLRKMIDHFGRGKFVRPRPFPDVSRIIRFLSRHDYARSLLKFGFMNLTSCGLCKLGMHVRSIAYCLQHHVGTVRDGANKSMYIFPAQMPPVLGMIRDLYREFGIEYENPVFELDDPQGLKFGSQLHGTNETRPDPIADGLETAGVKLYRMGILSEPDVKGRPEDKSMQARCFQFVLFNVFARWYFLERHDFSEYERRVAEFYTDRIALARELVTEYRESPRGSRLLRLMEG